MVTRKTKVDRNSLSMTLSLFSIYRERSRYVGAKYLDASFTNN